MLEVKNAELKYGDFVAVKSISFELNEGEVFGLLGTNGAGKTTTFRMIMGLLKQSAGEVKYYNHEVSYKDVDEIGYMIEERSLLPKMRVKDLVYFFGGLRGVEKSIIDERLDYWLDRFQITDYKNKKIKELSKGNQQKVQFISAIINNPKLLILDEPFSGLDPINTELFSSVIKDFKNKGSMVIFSSHQLDFVEEFCEKIVILAKGEVIIEGYIDDIKRDFKKKNIIVVADNVDINALQGIKGVISVEKRPHDYFIKIENDDVVNAVFDYVKKLDNVKKFDVVLPKLSEIFISKVGENS